MDEKISVIVPVYKVEKELPRCVESILRQTYPNLQIILVDDGSPDRSGEICDEYAAKHENVQVIHKENGGLSDARNAGIDRADGAYLMFVDSDDYIEPDMAEKLYRALRDAGAEMSICNLRYDRSELSDADKEAYRDLYIIPDAVLTGQEIAVRRAGANDAGYWVVAVNKLYSRTLFDDVRFPVGKLHEDEFVFHRILLQCKTVACVRDALYVYVIRSGSIMQSECSVRRLDGVQAQLERAEDYITAGLPAQTICQTLMSAMYLLNIIYTSPDYWKDKTWRARYRTLLRTFRRLAPRFFLRRDVGRRERAYLFLKWIAPHLSWRLIHLNGGGLKQTVKGLLYKPYKLLYCAVLTLRLLARRIRADVLRRPIIWFIATPRHGNLGDHAIVEAQYAFFADLGLTSCITELSRENYLLLKKTLPRLTRPRDCIIVDGGGNIGTLWIEEEKKMRDIIGRFPDNPIFIFPQTAFFEDSDFGRAQMEESVRVYSSHADLTVFCRDDATYDLFCQSFPQVRALYVPDMVLYRSNEMHLQRGDRVLLCMRTDKEQTAESAQIRESVCACLENAGIEYGFCSTVADHNIGKKRRAQELQAFLKTLSGARFVVTDRLHGMLFCAVTGTPCIALDNVSRKVSGGYAWIRHLPYIRLCADADSAVRETEAFLRQIPDETAFDNTPLLPYHAQMQQIVREKCGFGKRS